MAARGAAARFIARGTVTACTIISATRGVTIVCYRAEGTVGLGMGCGVCACVTVCVTRTCGSSSCSQRARARGEQAHYVCVCRCARDAKIDGERSA